MTTRVQSNPIASDHSTYLRPNLPGTSRSQSAFRLADDLQYFVEVRELSISGPQRITDDLRTKMFLAAA